MRAKHLEFLVEEASMEAFLGTLLPRVLPDETSFSIHAFQGKSDLLSKLGPRLRGYARWMSAEMRLFIVVDRDQDDCRTLKMHLENAAATAGLRSRTAAGDQPWQVVNRLVIEELEAWYFGDWEAVTAAYPRARLTRDIANWVSDPDAIPGGTWELFEKCLSRRGYFAGGLRKVEAARAIARHLNPDRTRSRSFRHFFQALTEAVADATERVGS